VPTGSSDRDAELVGVIADLRVRLAVSEARNAALESQVAELMSAVTAMSEKIGVLTATVAALTARLGVNSSNSSKPPSSDGLGKPNPKSLRRPSGRRPGGQAGRDGTTLAMSTTPDEVIVHRPSVCDGCGHGLDLDAPVVGIQARQVFDLPPVAVHVVEHRMVEVACPACALVTKAEAPAGVTRQVQYGPGIAALATLLVNRHFVPPARTAEFLSDLAGVSICPATVLSMTATAAERIVTSFRPVAVTMLQGAAVAHCDETGFRIDGKTRWVHSASNDQVAWLEAHDQRGMQAIKDIGIMTGFTGTLVHDAWAMYDALPATGHQLCNAHVLRELQAVTDTHYHDDGVWCWAVQAADAIKAIITNPDTVKANTHLITSALVAARDDPSPPGQLASKHAALRRRLTDRLDDYLRFTTDPHVTATNNPAEQEIRMVKIRQKISGSMRTMTGANQFLAIRSYLSTARRHTIGYLDALTTLYTDNPWLPATP
jgi:transposase/uncharacterized coiled-coil protein SlyX